MYCYLKNTIPLLTNATLFKQDLPICNNANKGQCLADTKSISQQQINESNSKNVSIFGPLYFQNKIFFYSGIAELHSSWLGTW